MLRGHLADVEATFADSSSENTLKQSNVLKKKSVIIRMVKQAIRTKLLKKVLLIFKYENKKLINKNVMK